MLEAFSGSPVVAATGWWRYPTAVSPSMLLLCGLTRTPLLLCALHSTVPGVRVGAQVKNLDQYGRNVAACSISPDLPFQQPEDIGTFLVSNGYAVAYR